jgi:hypothetical protein
LLSRYPSTGGIDWARCYVLGEPYYLHSGTSSGHEHAGRCQAPALPVRIPALDPGFDQVVDHTLAAWKPAVEGGAAGHRERRHNVGESRLPTLLGLCWPGSRQDQAGVLDSSKQALPGLGLAMTEHNRDHAVCRYHALRLSERFGDQRVIVFPVAVVVVTRTAALLDDDLKPFVLQAVSVRRDANVGP